MSTRIAFLREDLSEWSIVAMCSAKSPVVVSNRSAPNKSGSFLDFELVNHPHRIRVIAFDDTADKVYPLLRVGARYKVNSLHASLQPAIAQSRLIDSKEIKLISPDAIHEVKGDAKAIPHAPRNSELRPFSTPRFSIPASSHIASPSSVARCLSVSSFSKLSRTPNFQPLDDYNISGGVTAIASGTDSDLAHTNIYEITVKDDSTADKIPVLVCASHIKRFVESGQLKHSQIEIHRAGFKNIARRGPTLLVGAGASIEIKFQMGRPSENLSSLSLHEADKHSAPINSLNTKQTEKIVVDGCTWGHDVFISHAGPDKQTIAMPLFQRLIECRISCFYDDESLRVGDPVREHLFEAMKKARVVVFVLSPEFVGRKWPMRELKCVLDRRRKDMAQGRTPPRIVPVFHRWAVDDCKNKEFAIETISDLRRAGFFEKERQKEMPVEETRKYLRELANISGVKHSFGHHGNRDKDILDKTFKAVVENITKSLQSVQ